MIYMSDSRATACSQALERKSVRARGDPDYFRQVVQKSCMFLIACTVGFLNRRTLYGERDLLYSGCGVLPGSAKLISLPRSLRLLPTQTTITTQLQLLCMIAI